MTPRPTAALRPFTVVDQLIFHLDQAAEPWSVQCEVRVGGRLDHARVVAAARAATARHPIARARMASCAWWARRYGWEVGTQPASVPVDEVDCPDDAAVADVRARAMSRGVDLRAAPPFEVTLAHHPAGDYLMVNLHHVAGDGMSAYRLLTSIARAYSGVDDPVPDLDDVAARNLRTLVGTRSWAQARTRLRGLRSRLSDYRTEGPPARIAVQGGDPTGAGFAFHLVHLDRAQTKAVLDARDEQATVNDVLLAGLGVAIRVFNDARGVRPRRVSVMMPVNLRPAEWRQELASNIVSFVPVVVPVTATGDLAGDVAHAQRAVAVETKALKDDERAGTIIDLLGASGGLPARLRHRLHGRLNSRIEQVLDTVVLSNLGKVDAPLEFGDAGRAIELWFSPPARMPLGTAIGAATVAGEMFLTIRYCRAQFDAAGAEAFAATWTNALLAGSAAPAARTASA